MFNYFHASHSSLFIFSFKKIRPCLCFILIFVYLAQLRFDRDWKKIEAFVGSKTVIQVTTFAVKLIIYLQIENKQKRRRNIIPFFFFIVFLGCIGKSHMNTGRISKHFVGFWKNAS